MSGIQLAICLLLLGLLIGLVGIDVGFMIAGKELVPSGVGKSAVKLEQDVRALRREQDGLRDEQRKMREEMRKEFGELRRLLKEKNDVGR